MRCGFVCSVVRNLERESKDVSYNLQQSIALLTDSPIPIKPGSPVCNTRTTQRTSDIFHDCN